MRRSLMVAAIVAAGVLLSATTASASSVHLKGGKNAEPTFTDGGLTLRATGELSGLGNGDVLVTSGLDGTYPSGLPVAVVSSIERNAAYAFARITCTPAAGVGNFGQVLILSGDDGFPAKPSAEEAGGKARNARKGGE